MRLANVRPLLWVLSFVCGVFLTAPQFVQASLVDKLGLFYMPSYFIPENASSALSPIGGGALVSLDLISIFDIEVQAAYLNKSFGGTTYAFGSANVLLRADFGKRFGISFGGYYDKAFSGGDATIGYDYGYIFGMKLILTDPKKKGALFTEVNFKYAMQNIDNGGVVYLNYLSFLLGFQFGGKGGG